MLVAVDVQHRYRGGIHAKDRGTRFTLANGGVTWEADAAEGYAAVLADALEAGGFQTMRNDPARGTLIGPYWRRHVQAKAAGAGLYLACHVNAGGGSYGLTEFVAGTNSGALANGIVAALDRDIAQVLSGHARVMVPGQRGYGCLPSTRGGVLLEPFFGDKPSHQSLFDRSGLALVGTSIARAVAAHFG